VERKQNVPQKEDDPCPERRLPKHVVPENRFIEWL
jgi:hypothetical protein